MKRREWLQMTALAPILAFFGVKAKEDWRPLRAFEDGPAVGQVSDGEHSYRYWELNASDTDKETVIIDVGSMEWDDAKPWPPGPEFWGFDEGLERALRK